MIKKALKITIFFTFVLLLFSSCVKKAQECKIFPKIEIKSSENSESTEKNIETKDKIKNLIENQQTQAQISCKF